LDRGGGTVVDCGGFPVGIGAGCGGVTIGFGIGAGCGGVTIGFGIGAGGVFIGGLATGGNLGIGGDDPFGSPLGVVCVPVGGSLESTGGVVFGVVFGIFGSDFGTAGVLGSISGAGLGAIFGAGVGSTRGVGAGMPVLGSTFGPPFGVTG